MKHITLTFLFLFCLSAFAQNATKAELKPLNDKLISLQSDNKKLKADLAGLRISLAKTAKKLDTLQAKTQGNSDSLLQTKQELGTKISDTEKNATQKIEAIDTSLSKNSLYGIMGVLAAILLSALLYFLMNKRQQADKTDIIAQLSQTKTAMEENLVKEFAKQTELMETQITLLKAQKPATAKAEIDHSLALKVASEINLIERNVNLMDAKTRGLKQLLASVGKLKDNLVANGYEMPELLGKQFHHGMKVIVTSSIPDENLEKDSEIITKILIPQVNYNDKMIQTAHIEVSVGY